MMSAHDRTYLASLAFGDPDKANPLHDLACLYMVRPDTINSLGLRSEGVDLVADPEVRGRLETPISKGSGQYMTTIGFVDALFNTKYTTTPASGRQHAPIFNVEVKIHPVDLGNLLRQIKLYRMYATWGGEWIFVAAFDVSETMVQGLKAERIETLRLGPGFDKFVKEYEASAKLPSTARVI